MKALISASSGGEFLVRQYDALACSIRETDLQVDEAIAGMDKEAAGCVKLPTPPPPPAFVLLVSNVAQRLTDILGTLGSSGITSLFEIENPFRPRHRP